jgi:branched-chain amino acid transport system substrate-binding protein
MTNSPTPIVIGNVGTTSVAWMKYRAYAVMQQAVQVWADVVNESGGIAGRPLRVEVADDANDPARHVGLVRQMVEQQGVVAFAGMPAVDTQAASLMYLERAGVPVVGGVLGNAVWGTSPILFPQGIAATQKDRMLMYAAATTGKSRYAFIGIPESPRDAIVKRLRNGPAKEAGIEVVFDAGIEAGAADYTDVCRAAQRAEVELMTIAADFKTQAKMIESCARLGFNPIYVTTGTATADELLRLGGEHLEGAIGLSRAVPWMADEPAALLVWREAMEANGLEAGQSSLLGWVSGRILEETLRRIDGDITPPAVAEALRGLDGEDLDGLVAPIGFGASPSEPNPGSSCFWPLVAKDGAWAPAEAGRVCLPSVTRA